MNTIKDIIGSIIELLMLVLTIFIIYATIHVAYNPDKMGIWMGRAGRYMDAAYESEAQINKVRIIEDMDNQMKIINVPKYNY